jgi:integrase
MAHHAKGVARATRCGRSVREHRYVAPSLDLPLSSDGVHASYVQPAVSLGGVWTPRKLRHSFVSSCAHDVRLEGISDLVGHSSTAVTETVYRHEIRPALTKGATAMNRIPKAKATDPA